MYIYILYRYWDTPDNEGTDIMGAYFDQEKAAADMRADADATKAHYTHDYWDDDMTWEDDCEIHLGRNADGEGLATIYCWEVEKVEVQ